MKLTIKKGNEIWNENDVLIGILTEDASEQDERAIELGSEAVPVIEKFIADVNSGSFKPRKAVNEFERIIEKYAV